MGALKTKLRNILHAQQRWLNRTLNGSCAVLLYHRVTSPETDPQQLCVSPEHFDEQIAFLKKEYRILSVDEFTHYLLSQTRFPANSVLLTFDDGYADNYLEALPILEKHQVQALFYVSTGTLNTTNEYWWDAVERIVMLSEGMPDAKVFLLGDRKFSLTDLNADRRKQLYTDLLPILRKMSGEKRELKIAELARIFRITEGRSSHRAMTYDELKSMSISGSAVIGAHTHLHPSLGALTYHEQEKEILQSKKILEEQLGKKMDHFSYPFGTKSDFNSDSIRICQSAGFKLVAANYPYFAHRKSNPFAFPRHLVRDWDLAQFSREIKSFFK